ncbi:hypothetical protein [Leptotrichia trevisanii]|uniref:Uncharacterized protein n=1 Tax=Leptotrichia trevisanii TaxID=109328 RepID=A0A510JY83_9FUSO|nr:hypothetical protein [Leptotrichia trevisanii]BBM44216.1 hypothetical protein JMUB3870_0323 [Leptotrichia trevisanii]
MRAYVMFSEFKGEQTNNVNHDMDNIGETLKEIGKGLITTNPLHSRIEIFPVFVNEVEFSKAETAANLPLMVLMSGKNTMFENRFNDLQFIDGTVIRIKGKITSLDLDKEKNGIELPKEEKKGLVEDLLSYDKLGSNDKKRFRQLAGKKIIEYMSNLQVINKLNKWATGEIPKEPTKSMPKALPLAANSQTQSSIPKPALSKIRKNMLIVYFNETKPVKKELSDKVNEWKDEGQAAEGLKRQEINAKITDINAKLQELNKNMAAEFKNATDRSSERKLALSKYKDEAGIRAEMEKLKEEYAKKYLEKEKLDSEIKILNSNVDGTNPTLPAPLTDAEKKEAVKHIQEKTALKNETANEIANLDTQINNYEKMLNYEAENEKTLKEIEEYKRKQKELIKEKEGLKEEVDKINRENKAKDNLESPKEFAESVFGVSFGIPVRYVRIPEVEVVSYNEKLILSESSEGEFELVVKQSPNSVNRVEVGDPIYFLGKQFKNVLSDSIPNGSGGEGIVPIKK